MSEFQYVGFRAVEGPLTDKQLDYMQRQSSRAEITRWAFDNTYRYGDFRGNAAEMLRRGYDVHVHYANFGVRRVMIRLPDGLPLPKPQYSAYLDGESVFWKPDKDGPGGILTISADTDPGTLDELWEVDGYLDRIVGVHRQLIEGDLRPLYVAWMCGCQADEADPPEESLEPPVPAGLAEPSEPIEALLEFFSLDPLTLAAAAELAPPLPKAADPSGLLSQWLKSLEAAELRAWLEEFLAGEPHATRAKCLRAMRQSLSVPAWPVREGSRTFAELLDRARQLAADQKAREKLRQERERRERLEQIAASPEKFLKQVDQEVARREPRYYDRAAQTLSDIGEAIGGDEGERIVRHHAAHLKRKYPTLNKLSGALRRKGLLS